MTFLITGFPRSGTAYMGRLLRALGYSVGAEHTPGEDGKVSWPHLLQAYKFDIVLHQMRNPLKVIGSAHTIRCENFNSFFNFLGFPPRELHKYAEPKPMQAGVEDTALSRFYTEESLLYALMWSWLHWTRKAREVSKLTYHIESFPRYYPIVFRTLNLPIPDRLPDIPFDVNTRKTQPNYRILTWDDLEAVDKPLTDKIRQAR